MTKTALILVDFQNDYFPTFSNAKWPLHEPEAAVENGAKLLAAFRDNNMPIIHVRHELKDTNGPFFHPNTEGAKIHEAVLPIAGEASILKHFPNSFRETDLKAIMDQNNVQRLVIAGAMSNMCIDAVTRAAADMGYECLVAHDACAACDLEFDGVKVDAPQVHAAFMAALSMAYAKVMSTSELLESI